MPYGRPPLSASDPGSNSAHAASHGMATASPRRGKRLTLRDIAKKKGQEKIVVLTAYTAPVARAIDPFVDIALVGDSLGMVLYDYDSTLPVSLNTMIRHGRAVASATEHALVVVDMPFGSYQSSPDQAFRAAAKIMSETGCQAVKLEGGAVMAETVAFLVERGIPVMGHVGMLPQSVNLVGGFRARGLEAGEVGDAERRAIREDAKSIAEAGAFSMVIEAISAKLATEITQSIAVPTIGIGASTACDGQVLVTEDMVGLTPPPSPRFVKRYAELGNVLAQAASDYAKDVREGTFPSAHHFYQGKGEY